MFVICKGNLYYAGPCQWVSSPFLATPFDRVLAGQIAIENGGIVSYICGAVFNICERIY